MELRKAFKSEDTKGAGNGMERGDLGEGGEGDKMLKIWCIWSSWKINWKMVLGLFVDILFHFIDCEMCLSITKADATCAVNHGRSYAVSLQCFFLGLLFYLVSFSFPPSFLMLPPVFLFPSLLFLPSQVLKTQSLWQQTLNVNSYIQIPMLQLLGMWLKVNYWVSSYIKWDDKSSLTALIGKWTMD